MRYVGGKNQGGTVRRIINLIPPHEIYIEGCVGSGAVLRHKAAAAASYAVDVDASVLPALDRAAPNLSLVCADVLDWLPSFPWPRGKRVFIYLDPPYLSETRKGRCYRHEMTRAQHVRLLELVRALPAGVCVMLSGYPSRLYHEALPGWEREEFTAYTRYHQPRTEVLWMNYARPRSLHDLRYVGSDYRERWNLKRRIRRWSARIAKMEPLEREALLTALQDTVGRWGPVTPKAAVPDLGE